MKRNMIWIATTFVAITLTSITQAQTVDEVLAKYFTAAGGKDKLKGIKTLTTAGKANQGGMEIPIVMYQKIPNMMRMDLNLQGQTITQMAYDGTTAWSQAPAPWGSGKPEAMPAEAQKEVADEADLQDDFIDYAQKGHKVELKGKKTIEGAECYEIVMTKKNTNVTTYYIDAENYVTIMEKTVSKNPQMQGTEIETYYSDFKEVDGMMMPHTIETKARGNTLYKMVVESIKVNAPVEDKVFVFVK